MAKGNMLLGFARNKLGDLVFSRTDGQQVIRARNRAPKNPNSEKQLVQRAVMANVMQLYSIGQSIFNHSFQGKAVGAQNQREFIRINTNKLRGLVVSDLNSAATPANCAGRVGARGINVAVPFVGMQISKGTYQQSLFTDDNGIFKMPAPVADETVAAYAQRVGLIAEDIYTFVGIAVNYSEVVANLNAEEESVSGNLDRMYNSRFEYVQLKVKSGLSAITDAITSATLLSTLFDLYSYSGEPLSELNINDGISLPDFISWQDGGAIGCIRSREFEDLRSSSYMVASTGNYNWGFASAYLLDVWSAGTVLQGTDLILEGSNFSWAGEAVSPAEPTEDGYYFIPAVITADGQSAQNLVVYLIAGGSLILPLNGEPLQANPPQTGLWQHQPGEEDVADPAFDLEGAELVLNVQEANAWYIAVVTWWNQHYGTSYPAEGTFVEGDKGDSLQDIMAAWKGSL